jgi:hypothetical protein
MDETRIRALVEKAFKAGFDWCLSGIDRYGSYNGGPIADGLTRFLELEAALQAASPRAPSGDEDRRCGFARRAGAEYWQQAS